MKTIYIVGGVAVVGVVALLLLKRGGGAQNTVTVDPAPPISNFTPSQAQYVPSTPTQPVIVGAIPDSATSSASLPPGINLASVALAPPAPPVHVDYQTDPNTPVPAAMVNTGTVSAPPAAILSGSAAIVDTEYMALFGRHAEGAGLNYWQHAMDAGGLSQADLARELTRGAQGTDATAATTKVPLIAAAYGAGANVVPSHPGMNQMALNPDANQKTPDAATTARLGAKFLASAIM